MIHDTARDAVPDPELVRRARDGDEQATRMLVERHHAPVYRLAVTMVGDTDRAQDITQDTFLKALRALGKFRGEASFRSWLLSIAANEARGAWRKDARRRETALEDAGPLTAEGPNPADEAVVAGEWDRARSVLATLPEKQRLSVTLRVDEDMSFREIGQVIGSSEGSARVNYFHGIRKLREALT